jgi:rhomboid family GlyGly-CTERM serine protease
MGLSKGGSEQHLPAVSDGWLLPIVAALISGAIMLGGDAASEWLRFDRAQIEAGQIWRLVSGHFAHLGLSHFVLNAAGLGLAWYLVGQNLSRTQWLAVVLGSILCIDLGFWLFEPNLGWYVGLSGLLHGVLVAGIVAGWQKDRSMALILALLIFAKLAYEQAVGPLPGSETSSGGTVVVVAHLYGAIGGLASVIFLRALSGPQRQSG